MGAAAPCPCGDPAVLNEKCKTELAPIVGPNGIQFKGPYPDESIELDPDEADKISKIAEVLKMNYRCGIVINSCQAVGPYKRWKTKEQCVDLTMLRGKTIRDALQAAGVQNPISIKGMGVATGSNGWTAQKPPGKNIVVLTPGAYTDVRKEMTEEPSFTTELPPWSDTEECQWVWDNIVVEKHSILFHGSSHTLEHESEGQVQQLADTLNKYPSVGIRFFGFTGKPGAHNKWKKESQLVNLSDLRVRTLRAALRNSHQVKNPIAVFGKGYADQNGPRVEASVASAAEVEKEEAAEGPPPQEHQDDIYDGQWLKKKNLEDVAEIFDGKLKWRSEQIADWNILINDTTRAITMSDPSDSSKKRSGSLQNGVLTWDDGDVWMPAPTEAKPQDFVTTHKEPAKVREGADIKTKMTLRVKKGTSVRVVQVEGRRARIISPCIGWLSTRQDNGTMILA